jgi:hypothetical protein
MSNDFFFRMGTTHTICQDYALSGVINDRPFALISDGCSGKPDPNIPGSPFTDFGSRFLIRSTCRYLDEIRGDYGFEVRDSFPAIKITADALAMARQCLLPSTALDATLVGAIHDKQKSNVTMFRYGDGVMAARYKNGNIFYSTVKFGNNMPSYLRYILSPKDMKQYISEAVTVEETGNNRRDGKWSDAKVTETKLDGNLLYSNALITSDVDMVLIFSDGIESFIDANNQPVPLENILDQMFAISVTTGKFLTRRCKAFFDKFCVENKWKNTDDFSAAGLYVGG